MTDMEFNRLLFMLEALRLEIRAAAAIQQRTEQGADLMAQLRHASDAAAHAAGVNT